MISTGRSPNFNNINGAYQGAMTYLAWPRSWMSFVNMAKRWFHALTRPWPMEPVIGLMINPTKASNCS